MSEPTKMYLSWADVEEACQALVPVLQAQDFDAIIGVPRGGWVPATILAYALGMNLYAPSSYPGPATSRFLVVDDVCDTGHTFRGLRPHFPESVFVTPYVKPRGLSAVQHWTVMVPQTTWIVFPWGRDDEINR